MPESVEEEDSSPIAQAVEEIASQKLGVARWDRPGIYREASDAAVENGLPYWIVLVLSGGIATLGLALNSSAVVIGAMLVAPLLAPVLGLALSLAVGDGRLAVQTAAIVLGSTLAVVAAGALLTVLLPFQTITLEISARTRPTTLDLAIAVFSGLVGAVVTVARRSRLSAAIPGVAISVALIPPLAVAGFGIGTGGNWELIQGSLLLYGANLAGIVLSGMTVFLVLGMHRSDVLDTARRWHREAEPQGLAAWADRVRWVRTMGVFRAPLARVALVLAFAVALGVPLSATLSQIARETRVERAVGEVSRKLFDVRERASILNRQVVMGADRTQVYLRVATTEWFDRRAHDEFERLASARAGEPVRLSLEQLPARGDDIAQLAALLPGQERQPVQPPPPPAPTRLGDLLAVLRDQLRQAVGTLAMPTGMRVVGTELGTTLAGAATLDLVYAAPEPLTRQAEQMLRQQLTRALRLPELELRLTYVSTAPFPVDVAAGDTVRLRQVADALRAQPGLRAEVLIPQGVEQDTVAPTRAWLAARLGGDERIRTRSTPGTGVRVRVVPSPEDDEGDS